MIDSMVSKVENGISGCAHILDKLFSNVSKRLVLVDEANARGRRETENSQF